MKNIIFIAPPGAGKGVQSELLKDKYNMVHISTGDLLRDEVAEETEVGHHIEKMMSEGLLVDDNIILNLLKAKLMNIGEKDYYILDGFPRTIAQAKVFDDLVKSLDRPLYQVIYLNIDREVALKRVMGRIICSDCDATYNEHTDNLEVNSSCPKCSGKLIKRIDDNEETFKKRFSDYLKETKPLLDYYQEHNLLSIVDGSKSISDVFKQIEEIIND